MGSSRRVGYALYGDKFSKLMTERRTQKTMSHAELEQKINAKNRSESRPAKKTKRS